MFCPNENTPMHHVAGPSHYGQPVTLDQCGSCGGIWFDAFELFKIKLGEAQNIEVQDLEAGATKADNIEAESIETHSIQALDADRLRDPSEVDAPPLLCPRDRTELVRYEDPNFPTELILTRCPKCQGFWLNRGEFIKYHDVRQTLKRPKDKTLLNQQLGAEVERLLASHRQTGSTEALGRLGAYLSTPAYGAALSPLGGRDEDSGGSKPLDVVLNVLILLLRVFVFRA